MLLKTPVPQSPIEPMTEEFELEFGLWNTEPLLTLVETHQEPNNQPSTVSTESLVVAVHRQTISDCGGVVRPINKLFTEASQGTFHFQPTAEFLPCPGIRRPSGSGIPHHIPSYLG